VIYALLNGERTQAQEDYRALILQQWLYVADLGVAVKDGARRLLISQVDDQITKLALYSNDNASVVLTFRHLLSFIPFYPVSLFLKGCRRSPYSCSCAGFNIHD